MWAASLHIVLSPAPECLCIRPCRLLTPPLRHNGTPILPRGCASSSNLPFNPILSVSPAPHTPTPLQPPKRLLFSSSVLARCSPLRYVWLAQRIRLFKFSDSLLQSCHCLPWASSLSVQSVRLSVCLLLRQLESTQNVTPFHPNGPVKRE